MARELLGFDLSICGLRELGDYAGRVSHVVSILDPDYPDPPEFARYGTHKRIVFRFDDDINSGSGRATPSHRDVEKLLAAGEQRQAPAVSHVLIHCHAGISRSTATAVIWMAQRNPGREADAFAVVDTIRPRAWPNSLIVRYADDILGRNGALVDAMKRHHARIVKRHPDLVELIKLHGRAHDIPGVMNDEEN